MTPRRHPVDIAAQRVDFAVMGDHPEGMRQIPGREGIGRESLMHQSEAGDHPLVGQIPIVDADLVGQQHALVDQRARGEGGDVEHLAFFEAQFSNPVVDLLADDEQLAFEAVLVRAVVAASDEDLTDAGLDDLDRVAEAFVLDRNIPPAEQHLPFGADVVGNDGFASGPMFRIPRQKQHADAVVAQFRQANAACAGLGL